MALLSNVPTLSYIRWQNLLIIYKDEVYQIYNNHTNKPFIYFDAINSPNELIMSNKKLEERDGLFYIIFNDNGKYIIVPQTEIEINFSENSSADAVSSKILGFKEQLNEQSQKVATIETDVEGMKTTVSQFEESITKNETTMSTLEQRADEIDAEVEKITMDFSDDIVIRELRENTTMAILSIQSTLGLFSSDMNTYMKDNRLSNAETDEINAYKENLNNELTLMNLQTNNVIDLLNDKGEVEKVTRLNTAIEKLNTAINNLYTNIDTCSVDNVFTNNEIATIISYFGKANVAINELKNLIDECIYLSLGGRLVEEIGKIIVKQDQIQLSVSKNENSIRSTLSKEMSLVQDVVDENIVSLNNFRNCLNTISTDGAFTSDEIDVITTRANDLDANFDEMTSKKSEIEGNTLLSDEQKEEIDQSYTNYKTSHNNLLSNINTIITDGLMTTEEMIFINEEIENYRNEINNMNTVLFSSLEEINKNGIITDINNVDEKWAEIILDPENGIQSQVGDIQKQINDGGGIIERLNTAEQKITTDAIINTVSSTFYSKEEVDNRLDDIDIGLVVKSIDVMYYLSTSNKVLEGGTWVTEVPSLENDGYIWSKTVTTYTNESKNETEPICITGGKDGVTLYTWIKYSDNEDGSNMYDIPTDSTLYIGIATNKENKTESNNPSDYTWSKFKGVDGSSYYTWIRYADDKDGNGISDNPTGKLYIGFAYNKSSNIESNNPLDYMWSLIKGTDGVDGKDGTPYYTWIKYSDNENGSDMYDTPSDNTKYIGIAVNQLNLTESNDPSYYKWSKFKGEDGTDGVSAVTYYTWIKYADDEKGSGISNNPTNKNYIGFAYNKTTSTESNNPSDYIWSLIKGKDGVDGTSVKILGSYNSESELNTAHPSGNEIGDGYIIQGDLYMWTGTIFENVGQIKGEDGKDGVDGVTLYTWIKYSDNEDGSNMYDTPTDKTKYIGIATNKITQTESNIASDYKWSKFRGDDGVNGATYYTWIRYADDKDGNGMSNDPTDKLYIGFAYNKTTSTESNVASDYKWSLIKGTDGVNGEKGKDGTTYYTWIKYSDNANGSGMYETPNNKTKYIGIAVNKTTPTESNVASDYIWSKFKGEDGVDGTDGKGIVTVVDYYKVHASDIGVTNATSGFSTDVPQMNATNKYLWSYELITYTDNSTTKTNARVIGVYGENGTDGKGISSIVEYYAVNNSSTTAPTSFGTTIPTISATNRFLWNYEVINFTDGSKKTTDKRIIGVYGETGKTGRGISSIVEQYYLSTSKISQTDGSWVDSPPTWVKGKYMWTRSKITYSDNSTVYTTPICDNSWEAVNDVQAQVDSNTTQITTTKNKVATIETNLNGITQRVSSTESTVSSHTTQLGTVDSRINTAKNSAISTASSDATTKANNALADAKNYTNGQITTVNTTINNKVAEIKATTDAITQRVSSTESTTTNINTTLNKLSDGLNKWLFEVFDRGSITGIEAITLNDLVGKTPRQTLLVSEPLNASNLLNEDNFLGRLTTNVYLDADYTWNATAYSDDGSSIYLNGNLIISIETCVTTNITMPFKKGWNKITWVFNECTGQDVAYFTPALSSLSQIKIIDAFSHTNIDEDKVILNSNITNTNNRVAEITTNLNGITQRVSSTETTTTTLNGKVTGIDTRLKTAEQKITDEAIINTVSSTYATKTDVNESVSGAYSQIEQLSNKISSKVSSSDVSSIIRQSPSDIQIGFNGINDRIEINGQYLKFEAENGNRDMLLYGGQVCIYNNNDNTFMSTLGHVLKADTSYKGIGFLTGKNCNTFFIGRDSSWSDILTDRSPNPIGVFFINFAKNVDGDKGVHIRDTLYTTNNIQAINNTQPTITGFKDISCTNSIFDNWKSIVDQSVIMRYDGSQNVYLGKNLNGNGFMATGFKDITCTNSMFNNWKSIADQSTIMRYDGTNNIILGKNLYGNGFTATGFSTMTATQFTVSNSSNLRIARGELYDPKNGSVYRDYVKLDGTYLKGGTSEICFIRASDADWANIYAGTIYSKQTALTSDMNLKTDIRYVNIDLQTISESSGLMAPNVNITTEDMHEFIETLPMVSYRMKDDVKNGIDDTYYGFLAQEVLYTKVGSELIKIEETTNEKGETNESYRYSENKFVSFIAGALQEEIKERKEEIESLNNTIIGLVERIKDLEDKLNK